MTMKMDHIAHSLSQTLQANSTWLAVIVLATDDNERQQYIILKREQSFSDF